MNFKFKTKQELKAFRVQEDAEDAAAAEVGTVSRSGSDTSQLLVGVQPNAIAWNSPRWRQSGVHSETFPLTYYAETEQQETATVEINGIVFLMGYDYMHFQNSVSSLHTIANYFSILSGAEGPIGPENYLYGGANQFARIQDCSSFRIYDYESENVIWKMNVLRQENGMITLVRFTLFWTIGAVSTKQASLLVRFSKTNSFAQVEFIPRWESLQTNYNNKLSLYPSGVDSETTVSDFVRRGAYTSSNVDYDTCKRRIRQSCGTNYSDNDHDSIFWKHMYGSWTHSVTK